MELHIDEKDVEQILLDWAEQKWPGSFNKIAIPSRYSSNTEIVFSKEEQEEK